MDRLIAPNSVIAAQADTAPATGTPQFATDGNPATNIPATQWPAYQYNAIQEELIAVIKAVGLAPDRTNNAQLLAAIEALIQASAPVIGSVRNLASGLLAASGTKTVTADQVVVGTSLSGARYCLSGLNLTGNIATQMDTGSAPASGFVAEYLIYNPNAPISGTNPRLLYTNASLAAQPNVYGGANMPAGYTASALTSIWPTTAGGLFDAAQQEEREVSVAGRTILSTTVLVGIATGTSAQIPFNAVRYGGNTTISCTGAAALSGSVFDSDASVNQQINNSSVPAGGQSTVPFSKALIKTQRQYRYSFSVASGTGTTTLIISMTRYEF
ncbi:hypothetical protein [Paraburkholderia xenovorans]